MHLLYEEEGAIKAGTVLAPGTASYQVETPHGRRTKVKASHVVMSFDAPGAAELLASAGAYADKLDADFLWQCAGPAEFGFKDIAREYVGREPDSVESAGVLPAHMREIVIDRAMAVPQRPIDIDDLKIIVLMVYWSAGIEPDALVLDELCDDNHSRVAH